MDLQQKLALLDQCDRYQFRPELEADMESFLKRNYAVKASLRKFKDDERLNLIRLCGKLEINVQNNVRQIGYKFNLLDQYPWEAPHVYLDEPENLAVIKNIDYLGEKNRITNDYIKNWAEHKRYQAWANRLNLNELLNEVKQLFCKHPPVPSNEM